MWGAEVQCQGWPWETECGSKAGSWGREVGGRGEGGLGRAGVGKRGQGRRGCGGGGGWGARGEGGHGEEGAGASLQGSVLGPETQEGRRTTAHCPGSGGPANAQFCVRGLLGQDMRLPTPSIQEPRSLLAEAG